MGRILALDVGDKTIGIATSDETHTFAFPGKTLIRQPEGYRKDMAALRTMVEAEGIERIVVGLPLNMDGTHGPRAQLVEAFVEALGRYVRVPIDYQDERLTSFEAERMLIEMGRRRDQRKQVIDSVAASVILRAYLERTAGQVA